MVSNIVSQMPNKEVVSLEGVVKKWLKCRTKGVLCSRAPKKKVEPQLRGGCSRVL